MKRLKKSNRDKHLIYAIPCGLIGTLLFVLGLAIGMEFKDKQWGGKFDYLDLLATLIGGLIGQTIQILILISIL